MKRYLSLLIAIILVLSSTVTSLAQTSDYASHWSEKEISYMKAKGILEGYPDGSFRPENNMTKAEFYKVINGFIGLEEMKDVEFKDIDQGKWYYEEAQKGVAAGYLNPEEKLNASDKITRDQVVRIISIVLRVEEDEEEAKVFEDYSSFPKELRGKIGGLAKDKLIGGYPDGTFRLDNEITRAEVVKILHNISGEIINEKGTVSKDIKGNALVSKGGVNLKDMVIDGNLYLTAGIGEGDVSLDNVEIKGNLYIQGGGSNSIKINNSKIKNIVIGKKDGLVRVVLNDSKVEYLNTKGELVLILKKGTTIKVLGLDGDVKLEIEAGAEVEELNAKSEAVVIQSKGTIKVLNTEKDIKVNGKKVSSGTEQKATKTNTGGSSGTGGGSSSGGAAGSSGSGSVSGDTGSAGGNEGGIIVPKTYAVTFTVTDEVGLAEYVEININNKTIITDSNGKASIGVNDGTYNYSIIVDGYSDVAGSVKVNGKSEEIAVGLEVKEKIARVSSSEELKKAINDDSVTQIHIVDSFTIDFYVNKTIIIPEGSNNITLNGGGQVIEELIIKGDDNEITNATINKLFIDASVNNLILDSIKDTEGSDHIFAGGGGNSITLHGDTVFSGNIKITAGKDIQIKSKSEGAKIIGTVSVESTTKTIISVPVTNLVVNSVGSNIVINSKIDTLEVRENADIIVKEGVDAPIIKARIGTEVSAKDEDGTVVEIVVSFEYDFYELDYYLEIANSKYEKTTEGEFEGNVPSSARSELFAEIEISTSLRDKIKAIESESDPTIENQTIIDEAAETLIAAIDSFDKKVITTDKKELNYLLGQINRFMAQVKVGDKVGDYPSYAYDNFLQSVNSAKAYLQGQEISQDKNDLLVTNLRKSFDLIKSSKIVNEDSEGSARFVIRGNFDGNQEVEIKRIQGLTKGSSEWRPNWERLDHLLGSGAIKIFKGTDKIDIAIEFNDIDEYSEFVIPFKIYNSDGNYVGFLRTTSDEIKDNLIKEIDLRESKAVKLGISNIELAEEYGLLYLLDESEREIGAVDYHGDIRILPGQYAISYIGELEEASYYGYKDKFTVYGQDIDLTFGEDDFIKIETEFTHNAAYKYKPYSIFPAKYNTSSGIKYRENSEIFISKGEYEKIIFNYIVSFDGKVDYEMSIHHRKVGKLESNADMPIKLNDDFKFYTYNSHDGKVILDDQFQYLDVYIKNDLGQEVYNFYKSGKDGDHDNSYSDKYMIKMKTDQGEYGPGKIYTKKQLDNLKYSDLIDNEELMEFTMEISLLNIPIVKATEFTVIIRGSDVRRVEDLIEEIPAIENLTLDDKGTVKLARSSYDSLPKYKKTLVRNLGKLNEAEDKILDLEEAPVVSDGKISFIIKGEVNKDIYPEISLHEKRYSNYSAKLINYDKLEYIDGGVKIDIDYKGTPTVEDSYISIVIDNCLIIEKVSSDEIKEGMSREIVIADSLVPLDINIENQEKVLDGELQLTFISDEGNRISSLYLNRKFNNIAMLPKGEYDIQYNAITENNSYTLFREGIIIDQPETVVDFKKEDMALFEVIIEADDPTKYTLQTISGSRKNYNGQIEPRLVSGNQSIYMSTGSYNDVTIEVIVGEGENLWSYSLSTPSLELYSNHIHTIDDKFEVDIDWRKEDVIDINRSLGEYINNVNLLNGTGKNSGYFWRLKGNGSHDRDKPVNGTVVIRAGEEEYSKEVVAFDFKNITIKDIIGEIEVTGAVTIEFRVDGTPMKITPFIKDITIGG